MDRQNKKSCSTLLFFLHILNIERDLSPAPLHKKSKPMTASYTQTHLYKKVCKHLIYQPPTLCKLDKVLLTMYKEPVGQYANYIDEGMERANDSQSVKCFYCLPARADPLTPFDDPQAKGQLSWGSEGTATLLATEGLPR